MTYLVLARKWRPRSFDTLVGQDHVVRALTHALDTQRLHHAWLFTGTRGVGKTTLSRILAKSLNCEKGVTAHPCGQCRACTEIDAGRYVDYVELDAASNRGVDEMTQLLEQAVYAPSSARFKVYMIDEVHMLTGHAFNAMLKTLEEPPPHVKFILATTDPQKIPVTVLSRCLQFNLKHMTVEAIVEHLQGVLREEGLPFDIQALRLIGQAAGGSMRDALSLTDQAIAYSAGNLTLDAVQGMLGTIDQRHLLRLLRALAAGKAPEVLAVADELASRGLSYAGALADLAVLLSRVAICQRVPSALDADDPLAPDIAGLAAALHPDLLQIYYSVAVHSRSELSLAPDEYAGFVMACLRMLSLTPASPPLPEPPPIAFHDRDSAGHEASAAMSSTGSTDQAAPMAAAESPTPEVSAKPAHAAALPSDTPLVTPPQTADDDGPDIPAWEALPEDGQAPVAGEAEPVERDKIAPSAAPEPVRDIPLDVDSVLSVAEGSDPAAGPEGNDDGDIPEWEPAMADAAFADAAYEHPGFEEPGFEEPGFDVAQLAPVPREKPSAASRSPRLARMTAQDWPALAASLRLTGLADELARQSEWVGAEGDTVTLRVAVHSLAATKGQARLRTVLTEHFGKVVQLRVEFGATGAGTARAVELQERAQRQKEAETAVANDPFVRSLIEEFGARVVPGSIAAVNDAKVA